MDIITYDFEVTKYNWLVVFKRVDVDEVTIIWDDPAELRDFYEENKGNIMSGFNVKYYDVPIFRAIMSGLNPYEVSQMLIEERIPGYRIPGIKRYPLLTYDLSQDIQGAPFLSLKEAEGNLGLSIVESTVPFDIDRPLTQEEMDEMEDYCIADVVASERLFKTRYNDFKAAILLINKFDLGIENIDKTTAQLTAMILKAKKGRARYDEMIYDRPDEVQVNNQEILAFYDKKPLNYKDRLKVEIAGIPHTLAFGGLHGAKDKQFIKESMVLLDVSQYYPSLMNRFGFVSRNVPHPEDFEQITDERTMYKRSGHVLEYPYKIIIAATYGAMKNKYNNLYDPKMPNQVCITGQLLLIDLIEDLEPYITLIQSNTDGVLCIPHDIEKVREIVAAWQDRTGMVMDEDWGTAIWQKDVNNYIYEHEDGKLTLKGGYVKLYYGGDYRANSMAIIDKAVVDYIVHGIDPMVTVHDKKHDLIEFQQIAKSGATFSGNVYDSGDGMVPVNKVNRIFATTDKSKGKVYKIKGESRHAIPNSPDHCVIINESIEGLNSYHLQELDRSWYAEMAWKRIEDFGLERG